MRRVCFLLSLLLCSQSGFAKVKHSFLEEQLAASSQHANHASQYPIVLQHGLFGFRKMLFIQYFHDIPRFLRERGYQVFATRVDPIGTVHERATQLGEQIDEILELTGNTKVNLIGHSMGGLDARYLVAKLGYESKIASVSMIATPNRGSYVADFALSTFHSGNKVKRGLLTWMGLERVGGKNVVQRAFEAIRNVSQAFVQKEFNPTVLDIAGVYYQSWAGSSSLSGSTGDQIHPLFLLTYPILKFREGLNDGLVTVESAKWGDFRGVLAADHLDQVGFAASTFFPRFKHRQFYGQLAASLAARGF